MTTDKHKAALYLGRLLNEILDEGLAISQNKGRPRRFKWLKEKAQEIREQFALEVEDIGKAERREIAFSRR